jgi:hypothetical protein
MDEDYINDWYCQDCEHGPMSKDDSHCTRCGAAWEKQNGILEDDYIEPSYIPEEFV